MSQFLTVPFSGTAAICPACNSQYPLIALSQDSLAQPSPAPPTRSAAASACRPRNPRDCGALCTVPSISMSTKSTALVQEMDTDNKGVRGRLQSETERKREGERAVEEFAAFVVDVVAHLAENRKKVAEDRKQKTQKTTERKRKIEKYTKTKDKSREKAFKAVRGGAVRYETNILGPNIAQYSKQFH